jgi:deazaflavin-dependent oxidoreductase (nitroreductase family)
MAVAAPVRPAPLVRLVLAPMTTLLNPLVRRMAGRRHFAMAARIDHIGRKSGKRYVTPVGAAVTDGVALIPLTFGNRSDWARNVSAAGECSVRLRGVCYHAVRPRFLDTRDAAPLVRAAFGPGRRLAFELLGIRQFMALRVSAE